MGQTEEQDVRTFHSQLREDDSRTQVRRRADAASHGILTDSADHQIVGRWVRPDALLRDRIGPTDHAMLEDPSLGTFRDKATASARWATCRKVADRQNVASIWPTLS